jgi:hypothetical protein
MWQGTKQLLRLQNILVSDMDDALSFLSCLDQSQSLILPYQPWSLVNELKAVLAHIVVTHDIKFEEQKQSPRSPRDFIINSVHILGKANAMFRKRQK